MPTNLFGETYETTGEYSRRLLLLGVKQPYYKIVRNVHSNHKCSIVFLDKDYNKKSYSEFDISGLYAIYNGIPDKDNCLYVGVSNSSISYRIYRFVKELNDLSMDCEDHPGARKARLFGIKDDRLYVKILPKSLFPKKKDNSFVDDFVIDEYIANMLQSRFNKVKRK